MPVAIGMSGVPSKSIFVSPLVRTVTLPLVIVMAPGVSVMGDHHRSASCAEKAGQVGQRMWMVDVDDVGALPAVREVARGDLLGAEGAE